MNNQKSKLHYMNIKEITLDIPQLKGGHGQKSLIIANWMIDWISAGIEKGILKSNYVLPPKSDFAYLLGVSLGTIQNAIKYVEDKGFVIGKKCIGTLIRDCNSSFEQRIDKKVSMRYLAIEEVKKYIKISNLQIGDSISGTKSIGNFSLNATRAAFEILKTQGILTKGDNNKGWFIASLDFDFEINKQAYSLVDLISQKIECDITKNMQVGDRIPNHHEYAQKFNVSIKTVNESIKKLVDKNILISRRGNYGVYVVEMPNENKKTKNKLEYSIFANASDAAFYRYEKIIKQLKNIIIKNYQIGDKLPTLLELSDILDVNINTVRRALKTLEKDGYIVFSRGRYGGTFVIDIPELEKAETFRWIAVNPQYTNSNVQIQN